MTVTRDPAERFHARVKKTDDCWLWQGRLDHQGYGRIAVLREGRAYKYEMMLVHRFAYSLAHGPIPDGLEVDHVKARGCTNRHCVNPAHLEAVTKKVNTLRSDSFSALNAAKTHCKHGHAFTPENTRPRKGGGRTCRSCDAASQRLYRQRRQLKEAA